MGSKSWDVSGMATKYGVKCTDGRTILNGAFDDQDGVKVSLKWAHDKSDPTNVLGYAILHSVDGGMRADSYFDENSTKSQYVKGLIEHGTPLTYSIHATDLVQHGFDVAHGIIKEVSIVPSGANPGAVIDSLALAHADGYYSEEEALITFGDVLEHSADEDEENLETESEAGEEPSNNPENPEQEENNESDEAGEDNNKGEEGGELAHSSDAKSIEGKSVEEVINGLDEGTRDVVMSLIGMALIDGNKQGGKEMAHSNIFEEQGLVATPEAKTLSHADKLQILSYAESCGSFQKGLAKWAEENLDEKELSHGVDAEAFTYLLPEFKNANGDGVRDVLEDDMSWVNTVVSGAHKLPFARVKTETIDIRGLRAKGYKKGNLKTDIGDASILHRETTPTMVYAKDSIDRQDILELKGNFEIVPFMRQNMQKALKLELAIATLFGDGREVGDDDKIKEECIRPVWKDDELYTMHVDLDVDAMAATLQGTDTTTYFGEGFVESEAMIKVVLDAMIDYKGRGNMVAFMDPWYVNKLLLARDRDGHRIYKNKQDLADTLGFARIETVEQIKDLEPRTSGTGQDAKLKKLVCLALNMQDYAYGNVQGGEVTHFENFDIDYNKQKYLDETYLSGAMRRVKSAIAIEVDVTDSF